MSLEIERALLAALRRGDAEPYELPEASLPALERVLSRAVVSPHALEEIKRALALATGLRNLGAIAASTQIETLLKNEPAATSLISEHLLAPQTSPPRRSSEPLRAPMIDGPKHAGPRVADFLNPGRTDRNRR